MIGNGRKTGGAGSDFGTMGMKAAAVVATLMVVVTADGPVTEREAGAAVHVEPAGAPEHANAIVPLKPPAGVKTSE